ncbi:MAG: T9SS type A sorting domain-containing protein [bacterium]|nr:T9SS type A sorting domain-containing protein [bacterium]
MTRRLWIFALVLAMGLAAAAMAGPTTSSSASPVEQTRAAVPHRAGHHLDEVLLSEDWENGFPHGWETADLTIVPGTWHLDSYRAFGGSGTSWWVGDPDIGQNGGYADGWYMNLQTPFITLPAGTPTMRFYHRYAVEDYWTSPPDPPYNGWDGMNLRISVDSGQTWTVIPTTALAPGYVQTSLYSFGIQHCEGQDVPGWTATDSAWHQQTANLTAWAGQTVKIRFAFASDPAVSTEDSSRFFGWMVDNIRCYAGTDTFFSDNCDSVGQWTVSSGRAPGGNLWRVVQNSDADNGTMVLVCNNASTGLYNPGMYNVIMSPYVDLRSIGFGTVYVGLIFKGNVPCPNPETDPGNCDAWGCEVSTDSGHTWCAMNNPTCNPDCTSYRYVGDWGTTWRSVSSLNWENLYPLAGHVLRFRLYQESTCDPNVADGIMFDNFTVTYTQGFENDVSCYSLQVRYPNVAGRPFRVKGYFSNPGQNTQNDIGAWYRYLPVGTAWRIMGLPFSLQSDQTATRDTLVTVAAAGLYEFQARSSLSSDQNLANDTSYTYAVQVMPASSLLEIGYDNHYLPPAYSYWPNYPVGQGPLVLFTVVSDSVSRRFNLQNIKMQFTALQTVDNQPIRLHVYSAGVAAPGNEIFTADLQVSFSDTGRAVWKTVDVSGDPDTRNLTRNFWVWLETTNTDTTPHFPAIMGNPQPWDDFPPHNYSWDGGATPPVSMAFFFQLHATIQDLASASEEPLELPAAWSLEQNYPNPFNPLTEIRFAVPRAEYVTLKVYNLLGQEVATLVDGLMQAGVQHATFDGANLASGVYLYRVESPSFSAMRKMLLLK